MPRGPPLIEIVLITALVAVLMTDTEWPRRLAT